jgi:beta-phosphoglucomutase-like phosphatase (HAD superfamily)
MEPLHHDAFRGAAVRLIQTVDRNFTQGDLRFDAFWKLARRGFGLQEMDTIKVFTKAIARTWPDHARGLLERYALSLPNAQRDRILTSLTARDRMEPQERFLQEEDYQAAVTKVREAFKHYKDAEVAEILRVGRYVIREIPGSLALIRRGKDEGLLIGLATGSPSTVVKPILECMGILHLFDATVFNDDPLIQSDRQRKPFPFPYIELTRRLSEVARCSLDTSEGLALEDSLTGVRSAHAAGMPVVARAPSLPWLFKKLLAPAGEFDGKPLLMPQWERTARSKQDRLLRELTSESGTGKDKIYLLFQDLSDPTVRMRVTRANRQQLTWDNVQI